jgi:hypothetical protein
VAKLRYLGTTLTDQNGIHEEIKSRLNSGNACYHSVQSLLSSRLLSRNVKVKIYKTIILPVVLYECETLSFTPREGHRLRVFENRVLRRIFGPKKDEGTGKWRKLHNEELYTVFCTHLQISSRRSSQGELDGRAWERRENCTRFWWETPKERDHSEDREVDGIRMDLKEAVWGRGVESIRLAQDRDRWRALVYAVMNLRVLAPRS